MADLTISFSRWKTFTRCQRKYYYKYVLDLQRKMKALPLSRGSLVHKSLEAYYKDGYQAVTPILKEFRKSTKKMFEEERILYQELPQEVARILRGYHTYWRDDRNLIVVKDKQGPMIEKEIIVPLSQHIDLKVIIDLVVEDQYGRWVMDHKTCKSLPGDDFRTTDAQSMLYCWVMGQLKNPVAGMLWNYIRTKAPTEPALTQKGALSKAKIDTDKATYMGAIKKHGLNPMDYEEMLKSLTYKTFFTRVKLPRPKEMIKTILNEVKQAGVSMLNLKESKADGSKFCRSLDITCDWQCEFRPLCIAELLGHDTEFMVKTHYERRKDDAEGKGQEEEEREVAGYRG